MEERGMETKASLKTLNNERLTKENQNNIKMRGGIVVDDYVTLLSQIDRALGSKEQANLYLGGISDETKAKIEESLGREVFKKGQYAMAVSYDDIRHITDHFKTPGEIAGALDRMGQMIQDYDSVETEETAKGRKLVFKKAFPDGEYLSVEMVANQRKSLDLITIYQTKKGENNEYLHLRTSNVPGAPGEALNPPSGISIPSSGENVNGDNYKYSLKTGEESEEDQTETRQFKRWFGDSKVVDEEGKPMVMYHGTKAENGEFYVFDYSKAKVKGGHGLKALGEGNYFTSRKLTGTEIFGSRVIPTYLSIENPFMVKNNGVDFATQVAERLNIDTASMSSKEIQSALKERGYDGVMEYSMMSGNLVAVTFDSNQIKSATENIGTFDASNPDIRYDLKEQSLTEQVSQDAALQSQLESDGSIRAAAELG